jgi:hypothetical protein
MGKSKKKKSSSKKQSVSRAEEKADERVVGMDVDLVEAQEDDAAPSTNLAEAGFEGQPVEYLHADADFEQMWTPVDVPENFYMDENENMGGALPFLCACVCVWCMYCVCALINKCMCT